MCRIAGIFNPGSGHLRDDILRMTEAMRRGGPDDEGVFLDDKLPLALGHRRLSLIDLSAAGHQPMQNADGRLQLIFNGEIYNFRELKQELIALGHRFNTLTDTEVILKAWQQWNTDCFGRLNGIFALALWDKQTRKLILARDHAGIKPLYISVSGNRLVFGSEIRGFKAFDPLWPENPEWKIPYLTFGFLPEPYTTLKGVSPIPKGSYAIISLPDCSLKITEYNRFNFSSSIISEAEAVAAVKEKLNAAVKRQLISDAPIGLFLSGGIDSTILTLLAHRYMGKNLKTLSIVFEDDALSEAHYQNLVIEQTGANHHSFLVTENEFRDSLPDILQAMDQPSNDGINSYFISKYAHENGLTAVLSGLGADELFGGYNSFGWANKLRMLSRLPSYALGMADILPVEKYKKLSALKRKDILGEYLSNRGVFSQKQVAFLLDTGEADVEKCLEKIRIPEVAGLKNPQNRVCAWETNIYMQNQLLKDIDYMSMWHGLEVRVPFLDKEIIELAYSIAPAVKYNPIQAKHLLIKAFEDLLPREIWNRKKQGFVFPYEEWFRKIYLTNPSAKSRNVLQSYKKGMLHSSRYWCYVTSHPRQQVVFRAQTAKSYLFANLAAFSVTGGMEKFNRCFMNALSKLEERAFLHSDAISFCDTESDPEYFPPEKYTGFKRNRVQFIRNLVQRAADYDVIILGHINLAIPGLLVRLTYGSKKQIILVTHGIEVWGKLSRAGMEILKKAVRILAVSNFTKNKITSLHGIDASRIHIFHNTIDPHFVFPHDFNKPAFLHTRYGISSEQKVIFTLTRLSSSEKYKGYDKVIEAMPMLKDIFPGIRYIIAGRFDMAEKQRLDILIAKYRLQDTVLLPGFIPDEEVTAHYLLADVFVMPSKKEGFGIVFIEAMACGLPVIAGNQDGSTDALKNGELGTLVNPDSVEDITSALIASLKKQNDTSERKRLQEKVIDAFGFDVYTKSLKKALQLDD